MGAGGCGCPPPHVGHARVVDAAAIRIDGRLFAPVRMLTQRIRIRSPYAFCSLARAIQPFALAQFEECLAVNRAECIHCLRKYAIVLQCAILRASRQRPFSEETLSGLDSTCRDDAIALAFDRFHMPASSVWRLRDDVVVGNHRRWRALLHWTLSHSKDPFGPMSSIQPVFAQKWGVIEENMRESGFVRRRRPRRGEARR